MRRAAEGPLREAPACSACTSSTTRRRSPAWRWPSSGCRSTMPATARRTCGARRCGTRTGCRRWPAGSGPRTTATWRSSRTIRRSPSCRRTSGWPTSSPPARLHWCSAAMRSSACRCCRCSPASSSGRLGVVAFTPAYDIAPEPLYAPSSRWARALELGVVSPANLALVGGRTAPSDGPARRVLDGLGATTFSLEDVLRDGMATIAQEALETAASGTEAVYLSVDLAVLAGIGDPVGLEARELATGVATVSSALLAAADVCAPRATPGSAAGVAAARPRRRGDHRRRGSPARLRHHRARKEEPWSSTAHPPPS